MYVCMCMYIICSNDLSNRINHRFANNIVGSVDTFPIIVHRPKRKQTLLYNGKYKAHVYKVTTTTYILFHEHT